MNLTIRAVAEDDYPAITRIYETESVIGQTSQVPHRNEAFWRQYVEGMGDRAVSMVALLDDKVAGHMTICMDARPRRRHTAWFGIAVHAEYQSRGIGRALMQELIHQCDHWLNITKLELSVFADNERAIALYRDFGFAEEGRLVDDIFKDGAYVDTLCMARFHPRHRDRTD